MRRSVATEEERAALDQIGRDAKAQFDAGDDVVKMRDTEGQLPAMGQAFQNRVLPLNKIVRDDLAKFVQMEQTHLEGAKEYASRVATVATAVVAIVAAVSILLAIVLAVGLSRMLGRQIGSAVQHIQSSSSELQAAANQQTTVSKEQVASMTLTVLGTSRAKQLAIEVEFRPSELLGGANGEVS